MTKLLVKAQTALNTFKRDDSGATLIEYSLLIGLITVVVVATIGLVGVWVGARWDELYTAMTA